MTKQPYVATKTGHKGSIILYLVAFFIHMSKKTALPVACVSEGSVQ